MGRGGKRERGRKGFWKVGGKGREREGRSEGEEGREGEGGRDR